MKPKSHGGSWSQERVDLMIKLRAEGFTSSQIAARLGGITRNAVIGKLARLRIPVPAVLPKPSVAKRVPLMRPKAACPVSMAIRRDVAEANARRGKAPVFPALPLPDPSIDDIPRIRFSDVEPGQCKWIVGDHRPAMCCGADQVPGLPYCEHHAQRAYAGSAPRFVARPTWVNRKPANPVDLKELINAV